MHNAALLIKQVNMLCDITELQQLDRHARRHTTTQYTRTASRSDA